MDFKFKKSLIFGIGAGVSLLIFYFSILTLVSGWSFTKIQFFQNWYWIIGLSLGFSVQIALFAYLKALKSQLSGKAVVASGTASTIAMISCCSHYLVNILPIIGISGLAAIIGQYQTELFFIGAISNIISISYLVNKLTKLLKEKNGEAKF